MCIKLTLNFKLMCSTLNHLFGVVSNLEKEKASPLAYISSTSTIGMNALEGGEMEELEVAKKYLEYGVSLETVGHLDVVELDSERESLTSAEQQKILEGSPNSRRKWTYRSLRGSHQSGCQNGKPCQWVPSTSRMIPFDRSKKRWTSCRSATRRWNLSPEELLSSLATARPEYLQGAKEAQAARQVADIGPQYKVEIAGGGPQDGVEDKEQGNPLATSADGKPGEDL